MPFKLSPDIARSIETLLSDLRVHFNELLADFNGRPERWIESEEADEVNAWLDDLENLVTALENFPGEPGA